MASITKIVNGVFKPIIDVSVDMAGRLIIEVIGVLDYGRYVINTQDGTEALRRGKEAFSEIRKDFPGIKLPGD